MDSVQSILSSILAICCGRSSSEDESNPLEAHAHQSSPSYEEESNPLETQTHQSSSSTTDGRSYEVFLSFRGTDTRKNFTSHLYAALKRAGVRTFKDDNELERGEAIGSSLFKAITESRISIIIFSLNYASSKWCLQELAKMVECKDRSDQLILPIFLNVNPSDVRNQTGSFGKAFDQVKYKKGVTNVEMEQWRNALREVGKLSGWDLKEAANGDESKLITLVVKAVLRYLNNTSFDVVKYPVGIESRVEEMLRYLQLESSNVLFVGIWGLGGIGKTTIAKAVLDKISGGFQCKCFLPDIKEASLQKGIVKLQKKLLRNLHEGYEDINVDGRGKTIIKERLHLKKVLLILDDVGDAEQLEALAGKPDWFGLGSRVIITTRDKRILNKHQVSLIYEPEELDSGQSLQLFCKHAFCEDQPPEDYKELSKEVVKIAGGLPLTLEIFGSSLFGKDTTEWKHELDKLKEIPPEKVQDRLKLSYEGLNEFEKEIFLDTACFFIGLKKEIVISIWESCGFYPKIGIEALIHKSLVKIGNKNELRMHDHIRDMGREIIRQENWKEPEMRSRLWKHEEALGVLMKKTGTIKIEAVDIDFRWDKRNSKLSIEAFALMPKLRLLGVNYADLQGELENLPKGLRWLNWNGCPLEYLPTTFHLDELVVLQLRHSRLTQVKNCLDQKKLLLEKLKVLDLSDCTSLTRTSDLSGLPCLERLIMWRCFNLIEVDGSIGLLKRLVLLNLGLCKKLTKLPGSICKLKCLKFLLLSWCNKLYELPENLGAMESLTKLFVEDTAINQLPDSIGMLKNLTTLSLQFCKSVRKIPDSIWKSESLIEINIGRTEINEIPDFCLHHNKIQVLNARDCRSFDRLRDSIGSFKNLKGLYIDKTIIAELPNSVGTLENLEELTASGCGKLVKLPDSMGKMRSLKEFNINGTKINKLPEDFGMLSSLTKLKMDECRGFIGSFPVSFSGLCSLEELSASNCNLSEGGIPSDIGRVSSLRSLKLKGNNFCSLPPSINTLSRLQILDLTECKQLQSLPELPSSLTHLQAEFCSSIESLPDLSNLKSLKSLNLRDCEKLSEIQGLECLETIEDLQVVRTSFEILPDISNLKTLKTLFLADCQKLTKIQGLDGCEALEVLKMTRCKSIERLLGLSNLKGLKTLILKKCSKLAEIQGIEGLEALEELYIYSCTSIERLPDLSDLKRVKKIGLENCHKLAEIQGLEGLVALEELYMSKCISIERLLGLSNLKRLKTLKLERCWKLAEIQGLEDLESLEELYMYSCTSIERLPDLSDLKRIKKIELKNCDKITEILGLEGLEALEDLVVSRCTSIERLPDLSKLKRLKK